MITMSKDEISAYSRIDHLLSIPKYFIDNKFGMGLYATEEIRSLGHTVHTFLGKMVMAYGIFIIPIIFIYLFLIVKNYKNNLIYTLLAGTPLAFNLVFNATLSFTAYLVFALLFYDINFNSNKKWS